MTNLKLKLSEYIKKNNLNPSSFCKNSEISSAAIHNIINSSNANPTVDTVLKIADIMGCSLDELLEKEGLTTRVSEINTSLLKSVCSSVCNLKEMEGRSFKEFCEIILNIYTYSIDNVLTEVDETYSKWFVSKAYNKKTD